MLGRRLYHPRLPASITTNGEIAACLPPTRWSTGVSRPRAERGTTGSYCQAHLIWSSFFPGRYCLQPCCFPLQSGTKPARDPRPTTPAQTNFRMPISVAIVEDNAEICEGVERVLAESGDFVLVCSCRNARTAMSKIPAAKPDVVIMDIGLPDGSGIQCTAELKQLMPDLQIMMFTVYEDSDQIFKALAAGASGYLLKRVKPSQLLDALREMKNGGVPMTGAIARKVIASFSEPPPPSSKHRAFPALSPREFVVLEKLAEGMTAKELAAEFFITIDTVNAHLKHIYRKLHVRSRVEAVITYLKG